MNFLKYYRPDLRQTNFLKYYRPDLRQTNFLKYYRPDFRKMNFLKYYKCSVQHFCLQIVAGSQNIIAGPWPRICSVNDTPSWAYLYTRRITQRSNVATSETDMGANYHMKERICSMV